MSLSPYEMRNMLHHVMAGEEFSVDVQHSVSHSFYSVVKEGKAEVSRVRKLKPSNVFEIICIYIYIVKLYHN